MTRKGRQTGTLSIAIALGFVLLSVTAQVQAGPDGFGQYSFDKSTLPEGCKPDWHAGAEGAEPPSREDMMRKLAEEFDLTGQQQMDLQALVADYAERLQQMTGQMRTSAEQLAQTEPEDPYYWPLAQEVSALASAHAGETVILLSELRQKVYQVLTAEQRAEIKRRIEERKAQCEPTSDQATE